MNPMADVLATNVPTAGGITWKPDGMVTLAKEMQRTNANGPLAFDVMNNPIGTVAKRNNTGSFWAFDTFKGDSANAAKVSGRRWKKTLQKLYARA